MLFFRNIARTAPQWGISLAGHLVVLAILAFFYVDLHGATRPAVVISEILEQLEEQQLPEDLIRDEEIELDAKVSPTGSGGSEGSMGDAVAMMAPPSQATAQQQVAAQMGDRRIFRPLLGKIGNLTLDTNVEGLKGTSEIVTGGDDGSLDRIAQEILRELDKGKVLVAWVFDATSSLEHRREAIATRFDRIYHEFDELGVNKSEALMTAVVSAGEKTQFLLDKPSNQVEKIAKAIRAIQNDESGEENLITAIEDTANHYRRFQTSGRFRLMIVLITDEISNDLDKADRVVELLRRNRVPLYVMGPMAHFGRNDYYELWFDPDYNLPFWLEVKKGPYTRREEILRVPFHHGHYPAGFGPFHLTLMTRETGGLFFVYHDDKRLPPTQFRYDSDILLRYKPNYGSAVDYTREIGESELRRGLMAMADRGNEEFQNHWLRHSHGWLHAENDEWRQEIVHRTRSVEPFLQFSKECVPKLEAMQRAWEKEPNPKWRANYDLSYARLLMSTVRCREYIWALAEFGANPRKLAYPPLEQKDAKRAAQLRALSGKIEALVKKSASDPKKAGLPAKEVEPILSEVERLAKELAEAARPELSKTCATLRKTLTAKTPNSAQLESQLRDVGRQIDTVLRGNNGWSIDWVTQLHLDLPPIGDPKVLEESKAMLEKSLVLYQRVIDDHPYSPWHYVAQAERTRAVGVQWREGLDNTYRNEEERKLRAKVKVKKL